jgi:hypothetical protein
MLALVVLSETPPRLVDLTRRRPRADQRSLADLAQRTLTTRLQSPDFAVSRSHSRGLSGAAAGRSGLRIGLDIEYADPSRPWPGIISQFGSRLQPDLDAHSACQAWTFVEAWYKAYGAYPDPLLVDATCSPGPEATPIPVADAWRWRFSLNDTFHICVVSEEPTPAPLLILPDLTDTPQR